MNVDSKSTRTTESLTSESAATLERGNDVTRARLSGNLDALQSRLTPSQLLDQAAAYLRTNDGARFTRNLGASVRDNPMPAALTGIGLAWLMASNATRGAGTKGQASVAMHLHDRAHHAGIAVIRLPDETEHAHRARIDDARGSVLGVHRRASEPAESYSSRLSDAMATAKQWASQVQDRAGDQIDAMSGQMSDMRDQASGVVQTAMDQARRGTGGLTAAITGNPMLLGALGITAGALLGALLPHVDAEDEWLGDAGKTVNTLAHDTANEMMRRGEHAVQATMDAAQTAAGEQGLTAERAAGTGSDIVAKSRVVTETALQAGIDAVRGN